MSLRGRMGARPQRPAAHWVAKASLPVRRAASAAVRWLELRACSAASAMESQRSRVTPRVRAPVVGMSPKSVRTPRKIKAVAAGTCLSRARGSPMRCMVSHRNAWPDSSGVGHANA
eukprot:scaffold18721_cov89-Isochrysis_galbana.AAC.1